MHSFLWLRIRCSLLVLHQVLLDHTQPAFAGFLSEYLVHLQDEYPRTPVLLFSVGVEAELPPAAVQQRERRCVALVIAVHLHLCLHLHVCVFCEGVCRTPVVVPPWTFLS